jgi:hypothetical protein
MTKLLLPRRKLFRLAAPAIIVPGIVQAQVPLTGAGPGGAAVSCALTDPSFASVTLLCHMDQTNGATSLLDSSNTAQGVTAGSGAAASTARFKFGTASLLMGGGTCQPGGGATPFNFGANPFTVECQAFWDGTVNTSLTALLAFWVAFSGTEMWRLVWNRQSSPATLAFQWSTDGTNVTNSVATAGAFAPTASTWTSIACDRSSNTFRLYINGAVVGTTTAADTIYTTPSFGNANIGSGAGGSDWTGNFDEVRVTKGVARYAGAYTPQACAFPNSA